MAERLRAEIQTLDDQIHDYKEIGRMKAEHPTVSMLTGKRNRLQKQLEEFR